MLFSIVFALFIFPPFKPVIYSLFYIWIFRDWFNIEKSKRVKAFRCGEFDECIQRAESHQSYTSGDTLKYERREDAILYALELEKQELRKKLKRPGISNYFTYKIPLPLRNETEKYCFELYGKCLLERYEILFKSCVIRRTISGSIPRYVKVHGATRASPSR